MVLIDVTHFRVKGKKYCNVNSERASILQIFGEGENKIKATFVFSIAS